MDSEGDGGCTMQQLLGAMDHGFSHVEVLVVQQEAKTAYNVTAAVNIAYYNIHDLILQSNLI